MRRIDMRTIAHRDQAYDTAGDWFYLGDGPEATLNVNVSDMGNEDHEFLVAIHELVEAYLCRRRGIAEEEVSAFDRDFERLRTLFPELLDGQEPGHVAAAPYHREHVFAEQVEMLVAAELQVDWNAYGAAVNRLEWTGRETP